MSGYYLSSDNLIRVFLLTVAIYGSYGELCASSRVTHAAVRATARSAAVVVRAPALSSVTGAREVSFDAATGESSSRVMSATSHAEPVEEDWITDFVKRLERQRTNCIPTVSKNHYEEIARVMNQLANQMQIVEIYERGYPDRSVISNSKLTTFISRSFISDRPGMESWFNNNVRFQELLQLNKETGESFAPNVQKSLDQFSEDVLAFRHKIFPRSKHRLRDDHDEAPRR